MELIRAIFMLVLKLDRFGELTFTCFYYRLPPVVSCV